MPFGDAQRLERGRAPTQELTGQRDTEHSRTAIRLYYLLTHVENHMGLRPQLCFAFAPPYNKLPSWSCLCIDKGHFPCPFSQDYSLQLGALGRTYCILRSHGHLPLSTRCTSIFQSCLVCRQGSLPPAATALHYFGRPLSGTILYKAVSDSIQSSRASAISTRKWILIPPLHSSDLATVDLLDNQSQKVGQGNEEKEPFAISG